MWHFGTQLEDGVMVSICLPFVVPATAFALRDDWGD